MSQAIEKHVAEHKNKVERPTPAEEANKIREFLIIQVFEKARRQP